jgi:outer membrane protein TolC
MKRLLIITLLLVLSVTHPPDSRRAGASQADPPAGPDRLAGTMTYERAVGILVQSSPTVRNSSMEVQLRRLDESDSRLSFIPGITFATRYFPQQPSGSTTDPYSIEFAVESYNPVETYFNLKARKVITEIAILGHLQVISDSILRLGMGYLELEKMDRMQEYLQDWIGLAEQSVAFYTSRMATGGATLVELKIAEQELELGRAEQERALTARATILDGMKSLMGLGVDQIPDLDLRNARDQVINGFNPATATLEKSRAHSIDLKIQHLKVELQKKNVTVSYARFVPNLLLGVSTTDPLGTQTDRGLFFSFGFTLPVWDGLKRYHNITRQKTVLQQYNYEETAKESDLEKKWKAGQDKLKDTTVQLKLARSQGELGALRLRQVEIAYLAGRELMASVLAEQRKNIEAKKNVSLKELEVDKAALALRALSGDLITSYVDVNAYEKSEKK